MGSPAAYFSLGQLGGSLLMGSPKSVYGNQQDPSSGLYGIWDKNINDSVGLYNEQADIAVREAGRDATNSAKDDHLFIEQQANTYNNSGVLLEGSPRIVLNDMRQRAMEKVDSITAAGAARARLLRRQGLIVGNEGRAKILGSQIEFQAQNTRNRMAEVMNAPNYGAMLGDIGNAMFGAGRSNLGPSVNGIAGSTTGSGSSKPFGPNDWIFGEGD